MNQSRSSRINPVASVTTVSRRLAAVVVSTVLAVLGAVVMAPPAKADAATGCSFRTSSSDNDTFAVSRQLCWLDFAQVDVTKPVQSLDLGAYTLTFTTTVSGNGSYGVQPDPMSGAVFGQKFGTSSYFVGGSGSPIVWTNNASRRFRLSNITLTSKATGKTVPNYQFTVADAERTDWKEGLSIDNGDTTYISAPTRRIEPSGRSNTCGYMYGSGSESGFNLGAYIWGSGFSPQQRDLVCGGPLIGAPGMTLTTLNSPREFTVSAWSYSTQAFAIAVNLGRVAGGVTADTSYEKNLTGSATQFDLAAWNGNASQAAPLLYLPGTTGRAAVGPQDGSVIGYLPALDSNGQNVDTLTFRSQGNNPPGGDASAVFKRYEPLWTCTQNYGLDGASDAAVTGSVTGPNGLSYGLTNDTAGGVSTVTVRNPQNVPVKCAVQWRPRFAPATVDVRKNLAGTARDFPEVKARTYDFAYACTNDSFAAAYPGATFPLAKLDGSINVKGDDSARLSEGDLTKAAASRTLPQGANCTFTEQYPGNAAPALPGKRVTLTWGPTVVTGSYDSMTGAWTPNQPQEQASLAATNAISATNTYDYRGGTVDVSKTIQGEPVPELANTKKTYDFAWSCAGTDRSGTFQLTVTYDNAGNASGSAPQLTDVPVARDCSIKPMTGLNDAQSAYINFVGRSVTVSGAVQNAGPITQSAVDQGYHFTLNDYQDSDGDVITSTNASHAQLNIVTSYAYKTAKLTLVKQLTGPGAGAAAREFGTTQTFPLRYSCQYGLNLGLATAGTLAVPAGQSRDVDVAVNAQCKVWEDVANAPQGTNVRLVTTNADGTSAVTVSGHNGADTTTRLNNDAAQTTPVQTVINSQDAGQNQVVVLNRYELRLGTVTLQKVVNTGGITQSLPSTFSLSFSCGERSVTNASGSVVSVPLTGKVQLAGGQTAKLVATNADPALAATVNDAPDGSMQVPYGNACQFSEDAVAGLPAGISMTNDAAKASFTVGQPATQRTVTNTFSAAGQGLTLTQQYGGSFPQLAPSQISYDLSCSNGFKTSVTLSADKPSATIPNTSVPQGTTCSVTETGVDAGTRPVVNGSGTFPITRSATARMPGDGSAPAINQTFGPSAAPIQGVNVQGLVVGDKSVLTLTDNYDYVYQDVSAQKVVAFDPATQQWISPERQQVKKDRLFPIHLTCTQPGDTTTQDTSARISATNTSLAGKPQVLDNVPVGSRCTATEGPTTSAAGITVARVASFNGAPDADGTTPPETVAFTVVQGSNALTFTNTFTRQLATLQLNKIGLFPNNADIQGSLGSALNDQLHLHTFTLSCEDPAAADVPLGPTLTQQIKGQGSATFANVPVGLICHIRGDNFTQLDLTQTAADGTPLEAHLKDRKVEWIVDKNDGTTAVDAALPDGTTTSDFFPILPDANGNPGNVVDLKNYYEFQMTDVTFVKQVSVAEADRAALAATNPTYPFSFSCQGVGYSNWDTDAPTSLSYGSDLGVPSVANGVATQTYRSQPLSVPAGAVCSATELSGAAVPSQLVHTVHAVQVDGTTADGRTATHRAPGGSAPSADTFQLINSYARRTVPVRLVILQAGSLSGADPAGYTMRVTCDDPGATAVERSSALNRVPTEQSVASVTPPTEGGGLYNLPAGASCRLTMSGPALAPRPELALTQGTRTPFVEYGLWDAQGREAAANPAEASNPAAAPVDISAGDVTAAMKDYTLPFTIPADAAAPAEGSPALTVAAEAMHLLDRVTVTLGKTTVGELGSDASYTFASSCLPEGRATVRNGETVQVPDVAVTSSCTFREEPDAVPGVEPELSVDTEATGPRLEVGSVVNHASTGAEGDQPVHAATVKVLPVPTADDPGQPAYWNLALVNRYPSLQVTKYVKGAALSVLLAGKPDTAVLDSQATTMEVSYQLHINGGVPLSELKLTDPAMAGRTLTPVSVQRSLRAAAAAASYTVGDDGAIPAALCGLDGTTLNPGDTTTCTFNASISEPVGTYASISGGPVTATANADGVSADAQDSYAAIRPVPGALPTTGAITLVLVLVVGLGVLGYGLWRYRRGSAENDGDDDANATA